MLVQIRKTKFAKWGSLTFCESTPERSGLRLCGVKQSSVYLGPEGADSERVDLGSPFKPSLP